MTKFIFKSNASDLQKISQSIDTIQKNVLYLTYRMDMLIKRYDKLAVDKGLQKQVDEYFEQDEIAGLPTSPQTDSDEHE